MYLKPALAVSAATHAGLALAMWCYVPLPAAMKIAYTVDQGEPVTLQVSYAVAVEREVQEPEPEPEVEATEIVVERNQRDSRLSKAEVAMEVTSPVGTVPLTAQRPDTDAPDAPSAAPPPHRVARAALHREINLDRQQAVVVPLEIVAMAGAKVDQLPRKLRSNLPPAYPADALSRGIEGRVMIRALVTAGGEVADAGIAESSGSSSLDQAALAAVLRWKFSPALRGGEAVAHEVLVPVRFSINRG